MRLEERRLQSLLDNAKRVVSLLDSSIQPGSLNASDSSSANGPSVLAAAINGQVVPHTRQALQVDVSSLSNVLGALTHEQLLAAASVAAQHQQTHLLQNEAQAFEVTPMNGIVESLLQQSRQQQHPSAAIGAMACGQPSVPTSSQEQSVPNMLFQGHPAASHDQQLLQAALSLGNSALLSNVLSFIQPGIGAQPQQQQQQQQRMDSMTTARRSDDASADPSQLLVLQQIVRQQRQSAGSFSETSASSTRISAVEQLLLLHSMQQQQQQQQNSKKHFSVEKKS